MEANGKLFIYTTIEEEGESSGEDTSSHVHIHHMCTYIHGTPYLQPHYSLFGDLQLQEVLLH